MTLPPAAWRAREDLAALVAALGGAARYVGGAVRDTLAGEPVKDIDAATPLKPEAVIERLTAAGIKTVPTGIAHGTVTAVLPQGPVEVTTLRRDVSTDGRRATVAFTDDWREDAARRDFTINALYADPATGELHDYFGGAADLGAGLVRFIGPALDRIAEDHLRILRFFRFHARFGRGKPDAEAIAACAARANDLMALSRERIADELLKILALPDPAPTIRLMLAHTILTPVLPEIAAEGAERLAALVDAEKASGVAPDGIRRLAALLPAEPAIADAAGARLKLSNAARKRLIADAARTRDDGREPRALAYAESKEIAIDRLLIGGATDAIRALDDWTVPRLPISGGALIARGLSEGPRVAKALQAVERQWISEGFPGPARVEEIADAVARQAKDASA